MLRSLRDVSVLLQPRLTRVPNAPHTAVASHFHSSAHQRHASIKDLAGSSAGSRGQPPPSSSPSSTSPPRTRTSTAANTSTTTTTTTQRTIKAGIILKRNPVLLRQPTDYEVAHHRFQSDVLFPQERFPYRKDFFESARNNRKPSANAKGNQRKQSGVGHDDDDGDDDDESSKQNLVPYVSRELSQELASLPLAEQRKRLDRELTRTLYLLVKKPRNQHAWQFPQGHVESDESLREVGCIDCGGDGGGGRCRRSCVSPISQLCDVDRRIREIGTSHHQYHHHDPMLLTNSSLPHFHG